MPEIAIPPRQRASPWSSIQ